MAWLRQSATRAPQLSPLREKGTPGLHSSYTELIVSATNDLEPFVVETGGESRGGSGPIFLHYNFARINKTLRITPAMAAGLSDHVWSYEEIATLAS
jgi:hypothetical protein